MAEGARKFDMDEVNISILGRNIHVTAAMKQHIYLKIDKIRELCPAATSIKILFEIQKGEHRAEIIFNFSHFHIMVHAFSSDLYRSFDSCCAKLKAKLFKWKTKIKYHHAKDISSVDIDSRVLDRKKQELFEVNDMIENENFNEMEEELRPLEVVHRAKKRLPTLTLDEACMRFELEGASFLVYREESDQKLKVMCYNKDHELTVLNLE